MDLSPDTAVVSRKTRCIQKLLLSTIMKDGNPVGSSSNPSFSYGDYENSAPLSPTKQECQGTIVRILLYLVKKEGHT